MPTRITPKDIQTYDDLKRHKVNLRIELQERKKKLSVDMKSIFTELKITNLFGGLAYGIARWSGKGTLLYKLLTFGGAYAARSTLNNWFDRPGAEKVRSKVNETTDKLKGGFQKLAYYGSDALLKIIHKGREAEWRFEGNWLEAKARLKQRYGELTDDDLLYIKGKEEELIGRIQKKLAVSRQEVIDILNAL